MSLKILHIDLVHRTFDSQKKTVIFGCLCLRFLALESVNPTSIMISLNKSCQRWGKEAGDGSPKGAEVIKFHHPKHHAFVYNKKNCITKHTATTWKS